MLATELHPAETSFPAVASIKMGRTSFSPSLSLLLCSCHSGLGKTQDPSEGCCEWNPSFLSTPFPQHSAGSRHIAYCILSAALSTASSFRIWNSSTGILSLPGAGAPPMAKVMRKEARHLQRRDWASGVPLEILKHLPPNQSLPTFCFVLSPTPLTLWGLSPTTSLWKKS